MNIILFDTDHRDQLLPLTFTRPVSELRIGVFTIREKWERIFPEARFSHITSEFLESLYPLHLEDENILIHGGLLPNHNIVALIKNLMLNEALMYKGELLSARLSRVQFERLLSEDELEDIQGFELGQHQHHFVDKLTDLLVWNREEIENDIRLLKDNEYHHRAENDKKEFCELVMPDAKLDRCLLNIDEGSIYIGHGAQIMDGATIRGPVAIGDFSKVKMNSTLYPGTSTGTFCEVAGEIKNSIILDHSNKSHSGYLGDSVIGSYCNLGALTTTSNLKNTYGTVKIWNYRSGTEEDTGLIKCGLFMGDYSRTGILTRFNSGTVVGVSSHVFGSGYALKYVPSFTWGGIEQKMLYDFDQALIAIERLHKLKGNDLSIEIKQLLKSVYVKTEHHRDGYERLNS